MSADQPKIEDLLPELEKPAADIAEPTEEELAQAAGGKRQSRTEKKQKKALGKLGLKPFEGVAKVQIKQKKQTWVIFNPEVFKGHGDTFVVIGEPKSEEEIKKQNAAFASLQKAQPAPKAEGKPEEAQAADANVNEDDLNTIMNQAGVSREKAIATLKAFKNDVVEAVLSLTQQK